MAGDSSYNRVNTDNVNCFNVSNSYNTVNTMREDENRLILEWLSPLEPQQRHHSIRTDRLDSVGSWLLETSDFRKWSNREVGGTQSVLFCYGNPGVGKTYLTSLVIDNLCDQRAGNDIVVAGLYCDFQVHEEQTVTNMIGAVLKQLVNRNDIPDYAGLPPAWPVGNTGRLRLAELAEMLKRTIALIPEVFICIDALDESSPKNRLELLRSLGDIVRDLPTVRVFLTGRPHVQDEIDKHFAGAVKLPISPTTEDIKAYLKMRLDGDTEVDAMDDELRADIMEKIPERISEVFLLVSLNIETILGEITIYHRRKMLEEMTRGNGLGDAYTATMARMKGQNVTKSKIGMEVLMWVSHSKRPLQAAELCQALGVEIGSTDLNPQRIPSIKTLLGCCLGLVAVEGSPSIVRLVHFSL
ncbi:hypothetical protein L873DRAFT_1690624, partial [Choiromyces venosus 120613-1]